MKSSGIQMCSYKAKHGPRKWMQSPLLVLGHKESQAATKAKVGSNVLGTYRILQRTWAL
jgi:hypothetical protein